MLTSDCSACTPTHPEQEAGLSLPPGPFSCGAQAKKQRQLDFSRMFAITDSKEGLSRRQ